MAGVILALLTAWSIGYALGYKVRMVRTAFYAS